jgi:virginiamycin B lyase
MRVLSFLSPLAVAGAAAATLLGAGDPPPSSAFLSRLPDGVEKRKFILDCTGCHQFDGRTAFPEGKPRTREGWEEAVHRMLRYAGASTPFPVIAADRDPAKTAAWLTAHLGEAPPAAPTVTSPPPGAVITEFDHPVARDLPHDLMVDREGRVVITGMFTDRMWILDPATGRFAEERIPLERANPRALDIDPEGGWWVLLGAPKKLAHFDPRAREWKMHDVGMYPHSIQRDARGRIWFNGHFTKEPELIGYLGPATGSVRTFSVPNTPELRAGAGPIPYDLRVAPDGTVWGTELHGNRIFGFDPRTGRFRTFTLPTPHSGPRRVDFDARGVLWIPEYAAGKLAHFDPKTERFEVYPLPTRGALIRHIDVDARTGDLWAAYGASPGIPPKIVRIRRR